MTRPVSLSAVRAGITRLRTKAGASPESLFDGVNCYVTAARTIKPRPGSEYSQILPSGTIGLSILNDEFYVFGDHWIEAMPTGYNLIVLHHPDAETLDPPPTLVRIWKAAPFMGQLYVVAEWSDDPTRAYHYWIQSGAAWEADHVYTLNFAVAPNPPNGYFYRATRLTPAGETWAPSVEKDVGDVVEPTSFNGYEYELIEAYGNPPRTGATEPAWIAEDGATVIEEADTSGTGTGTEEDDDDYVPPGYENPGGKLPSSGTI